MAATSTQMRGPKSVAFTFVDFEFMTTNHVATTHALEKAYIDFHPIMDFMTQSSLDFALTHEPVFYPGAVSKAWQSAVVSDDKITITFGED